MTRTANFETAFDRVIGHEGRFQKNPKDRGNWTSGIIGQGELKGTKFGISAMTYPHLDIEGLTIEQAKGIYYEDWWLEFGMERFHMALAYQMFDAAINHGMKRAAQMLQRAVGVTDDGIIGTNTRKALALFSLEDVLFNLLAERLEFMANAGGWDEFGKGWARRIASNLKLAAKDTP